MLTLLILWLFVSLIAYGIGNCALKLLSTDRPNEQQTEPIKTILVGLAIITTLANYWSLLLPVTSFLCLLMIPLAACGLVKFRPELSKIALLGTSLLGALICAALCLSLTATTNIDEAGYYLPLVKWIESYSVTPGTALLNHRIGFNSGFHMLSAVFGMEQLIVGGIYKLNGLLFIVFNFYFFQRLKKVYLKSRITLPDLILIGALVFQFSFLLDSMDSDYLGIMGAIGVIAWSLEALEKKVSTREMMILIAIGLFLFTIRPFNAFLLAIPAWTILTQQAHRKKLWKYALWGGVMVLPWFVRNYYLSGYLIFPIHFLDLFNPEWKVPLHVTVAAHDIISEFAKLEIVRPEYLYDSMTYPELSEWWPIWLQRSWSMLIGKVVIVLAPISLFLIVISGFGLKRLAFPKSHYFFLLFSIPVLAIWFFNYPSIRFGWPWLLLLMSGAGIIFLKLMKFHIKYFIIGLAVVTLLSWLRLASKLDYNVLLQYPIKPLLVNTEQPYTEKQAENLVLKYSTDAHCYDVEPPCLPYNNPLDIIPRGETIKDGFKVK